MQGFGIQTKNINELISRIEKEISYITKNTDKNIIVLNNKLSLCSNELAKLKNEFNNLKEYAETEYNALRDKIASYDEQIEELKSQINKVTVKSVEGDTCASGITPMSVYKETGLTYPIYAKYAEKDNEGRIITETYVDKGDTVSATSAMYLEENKTKMAQIQAITGMMSVNEDKHQLILGF